MCHHSGLTAWERDMLPTNDKSLLTWLYVILWTVIHFFLGALWQKCKNSEIENRCYLTLNSRLSCLCRFSADQHCIAYSKSEVPNPQAADRYRSVGHLVPGRTERINNLHYFRFIYYLSLNDVLFRKMTRFSLLHPSMTHSWHMSRRLSWSLDTLPLKAVKILSDIKPVRGAKRVGDHCSKWQIDAFIILHALLQQATIELRSKKKSLVIGGNCVFEHSRFHNSIQWYCPIAAEVMLFYSHRYKSMSNRIA